MIRLPKFDFIAPESLTEALTVLSRGNGDMKILAGGTDLLAGMKEGLFIPKCILWLGKLKELRRIQFSPEEGLSIGAMCTLSDLEQDHDVNRYFPSLVSAARSIASPQVRNRATVGGNLCLNTRCIYYDQSEFWRSALGYCLKLGSGICHAAPELDRCSAAFCSDLAPLLIALGATVELVNSESMRTLRLADLYVNDGSSHLAIRSSEILCRIVIPYSPVVRSAHAKWRVRNSIDFPLVNVGVSLAVSDSDRCDRGRIVIGAVASTPLDIAEAAKAIAGKRLAEDVIDLAAAKASDEVHPLPTVDESVSHRKKMVRVLVKRALNEALRQAGPGRGLK